MGGLMDYRARFFSPALGRFLQPDSIIPDQTNPQAWNRFSYVKNNPVNFNDPTGHKECDDAYGCEWGGRPKKHKSPVPPRDDRNDDPRPMDGEFPTVPYSGPCVSVVCLPTQTQQPTLPVSPIAPTNTPQYSVPSTTFDDLVNYWRYSFEAYNFLSLVEQADHYGVPVYKQVKYAAPLGGWEYGIDAGLQVYDDWDKSLNIPQRFLRAGIRGGESFVTDITSTGMGALAAAGSGTGPVGYFAGAYSTSAIIDNGFTNNVNPSFFGNYLGGP
jgi:RHS repeat-associated protein